jgi:tetratricopeptide (TPR) repeat protein
LRCDARFALASLNRGLAYLDGKQFRAALDDLERAARLGRDDALLHLGRGAALEALNQPTAADEAYARSLAAIDVLPSANQTPLLLRYGFAVSKRLPRAAETAFAKVLAGRPDQPEALYGKAMLRVERGEETEAIACFDEALSHHPNCVDARRFRAVLLARRGRFAEAQDDINRCLQQEPHAGITTYAAACVLSRAAAAAAPSDRRRQIENEAIAFLTQAFRQGYGADKAMLDPDLAALRQRPEVQALLRPGGAE